ncbi:MAG TPA: hypothetical protein VFG04_25210 [Planctomycetaceae bacterium]|nr:hypothetical protein [Planctomycetaceae bacterium]
MRTLRSRSKSIQANKKTQPNRLGKWSWQDSKNLQIPREMLAPTLKAVQNPVQLKLVLPL